MERVDHILILKDGQVHERGPRAALAADPSSTFAALLRTGLEVDKSEVSSLKSPSPLLT